MYVLGIETSCDETSVAVVADGRRVLANKVSSSLNMHKKYGGVVPEIAFRRQLEAIAPVAEAALEEAGLSLKRIGLISVTSGPGLSGSLLVGISFAKALTLSAGIPLLGVNHLYSHIYANFLDAKAVRLPFVALVVSGGHTGLFYVRDFDRIDSLGQTQDDACGEAFDKVARILKLGYPGGPLIEKSAKRGNPKKIKFTCCGTKNPLDFSFSGIKTAVLYYLRHYRPSTIDHRLICDIAASFQEAAIDALARKSLLACRIKKTDSIVIGGGVVANKLLREKFYQLAAQERLKCYFPQPKLCMDNAAMVAGLGYQLFKKGYRSDLTLSLDLS